MSNLSLFMNLTVEDTSGIMTTALEL